MEKKGQNEVKQQDVGIKVAIIFIEKSVCFNKIDNVFSDNFFKQLYNV